MVFAPFIRDADFAARSPWHTPARRLLDYLLIYVEQGQCVFEVENRRFELQPHDFCLVQPGQLVELRGLTHTVTPYAHFDLWFNARREQSFATRPGTLDLESYRALLQPRLDVLAPFPAVFAPDADFRRQWLAVVENWNRGEVLARVEAGHRLGSLILNLARGFATPQVRSETPRPLGWIPSYLSFDAFGRGDFGFRYGPTRATFALALSGRVPGPFRHFAAPLFDANARRTRGAASRYDRLDAGAHRPLVRLR